jgi:small-conductance mechanosensitive channel
MGPLQYLLSNTVENLTKTSANLIKPIYLYVDYQTDVEQVRQIFIELLEQDEDWDGTIAPVVHVTNITEEAMEVRLLCSATTPDVAWYLRFRITEQMMARLRELETGHYLPKQRLIIERSNGRSGRREHAANGQQTEQRTAHKQSSDEQPDEQSAEQPDEHMVGQAGA